MASSALWTGLLLPAAITPLITVTLTVVAIKPAHKNVLVNFFIVLSSSFSECTGALQVPGAKPGINTTHDTLLKTK